MGYTHYWAASDLKGMKEALPIVKDILKRYKAVVREECNIDKPAIATKKLICFNGYGHCEESGHETFYFNGLNGFCKTARKAYDIVCCEILLVLSHHLDSFEFSSDGMSGYMNAEKTGFDVGDEVSELDGEWQKAIFNVFEHYGLVFVPTCIHVRGDYFDWFASDKNNETEKEL